MTEEVLQFEKWVKETGLLEQFDLPRIGIFGSFVKHSQPHDIDLLLDEPIHYTELDKLKSTVSGTWHLPCDVAVKPFIEPIIWHYIQQDIVYVKKQ